jgi:hypothetical protein
MRPRFLLVLVRLAVMALGAFVLACGSPRLRADAKLPATGRAGEETIALDSFPSSKPLKFFDRIDALDMRSWRYARTGNIEVLSRCADETTKRFVRELRRRIQVMKAIRPEPPLASLDRPLRLFLFTQSGSWEQAENRVVAGGDNVVMLIVNLKNFESLTDAAAKDASMLQATGEAARQFVIAQLLNSRAVSLAAGKSSLRWLHVGLHRFYLNLRFEPDAVGLQWPPILTDPGLKDALEHESGKKIGLLPMAEIFDEPQREQSGLWALQLDLFIRWALLGDHQRRREGFWKFSTRALTGPVTETTFKECFGTTYASVQPELAGYLVPGRPAAEFPAIARSGLNWPSLLELDDAAAAEIGRFKTAVDDVMDRQPRL